MYESALESNPQNVKELLQEADKNLVGLLESGRTVKSIKKIDEFIKETSKKKMAQRKALLIIGIVLILLGSTIEATIHMYMHK